MIQVGGKSRERSSFDFDHHPLLAIWELTQACDLMCAHCRACAIRSRDREELDTSEGKKLLADIRDMGTPLVVLTGGDPAKRPDLVELVAEGARLGLEMAVTPSGTELMTEGLVMELRRAGLTRLAVSVDGPNAATHDVFRGVSGSFDQSIRILRAARGAGLERQINFSITPRTRHAVEAMVRLSLEIGARLLSVFFVVPTGRADATHVLSAEEVESVLVELAHAKQDHPELDIKTTAAPHFRRVLLSHHQKNDAMGVHTAVGPDGARLGPRGINDGLGFVFVSHRGDIFPSGFLPIRVGNVRSDSIADVYRRDPVMVSLRRPDLLGGKCGACEFRRVCGGSRARAFAQEGNAFGADPSCAYVPPGYEPTRPRHRLSLTGRS